MKAGTVKLMREDGSVICEQDYTSVCSRHKIVDRWKVSHPDKEFLTVHICPLDGSIQRKEIVGRKSKFVIPDAPKPPIVRPPATYSNNNHSLYP